LRTDGAARGNPGPSSAGIVVEDADGKALSRMGRLLGRGTNNEAEYRAAILALEEALRRGAGEVALMTDSQLLAFQVKGVYRIKAGNLRPLLARLRELLAGFECWEVLHVPRSDNREADRMANRALDEQADVDG